MMMMMMMMMNIYRHFLLEATKQKPIIGTLWTNHRRRDF